MLRHARWLCGLVLWFLPSAGGCQEGPQSAVFAGAVVDTAGTPIANAEVAMPGLALIARTNELGGFRLTGIPAGTHAATIRRVGYGPLDIDLEFAAGQTTRRRMILSPVVALDEVEVVADRPDTPLLREFEENRRLGLGRFLTRAELEKQESRFFADVVRSIHGTRILQPGSGNQAWLVEPRGPRSLHNYAKLDPVDVSNGAQPGRCYSLIYLDNQLVYRQQDWEPLFNLNSIRTANVEAVEFYSSPAQVPARYSGLGSPCGVLVIHTRRP